MLLRRLVASICLGAALCLAAQPVRAEPVTVYAAASLQESLSEVARAYAAVGREAPVLSFASSSALARQIEFGAPAALFISADEPWMDHLARLNLIDPATRKSFLSNRLVLVAPVAKPLTLRIHSGFPLSAALKGGKLAMGDPESVPAGRYGKAALVSLGVWREVEGQVVRAENVRAALAFVERGAARAGIVYATDATVAKGVTVVGTFPETSHPPISYPLAIIKKNDSPEARAFRDYLLSSAAAEVFARAGFHVR